MGKWSPEKLKNHRGMLGKTHGLGVREAISRAQKGRTHESGEGFQPGHPQLGGQESQFKIGFLPWNKGNRNRDPVKIKVSTYRANAKKRGLAFTVTLAEMCVSLSSPCAYCGDAATGIDRVDNNRGYEQGNMVACCKLCNHMKYTMSRDDFIARCRRIVMVTGYEI